MQRRELIEMMDQRSVETFGNIDAVRSLAEKYPYCATFQVLKAVGLRENDSLDFSAQLNRAAIAIQDRSKLYNYIVKDQLLRRIEDTERESTAAETASLPNDSEEKKGEFAPDPIIDSTEKETPLVTENDDFLNPQPLEAEIMREAIAHLGEMEAQQSFQDFNAGDSITDEAANRETSEREERSSEPMSFGKWLLQKDQKETEKKNSQKALINKFIQESPQISPVKTQFFSPSQMGKISLVEDESFVTETLANIYERQGDFKKAANAYKNLNLKFPEKRIYFADLQKKAEDQLK